MTNVVSSYDEVERQLLALLPFNRRILVDALRAVGAAGATITYFGSGDSGGVEDVRLHGATKSAEELSQALQTIDVRTRGIDSRWVDGLWHCKVVERDWSLRDALVSFATDALEAYHPGFENNDGGEGEVIIDCVQGNARIEHRDFYIESVSSETSL